MIRRWRVDADMELHLWDGGTLPYVSRDALVAAALDGVSMVDRGGGVFQMVVERGKTDVPGEMVTTAAIAEWRSRTDARAEPEQETRRPAPLEKDFPDSLSNEPPPEDDPTQYRAGEPVDDIGDGIDPNTLPEEDDSEVTEPVH